ncbi:cation:proton antiporter [Candidatus Amarobacter glycogenicus]|uniref:cation:proton antiporter domain-containing protein n=1 Tax=Candidatus Amarobacter glycogenicus TaxID=3140699 RepID=UPI0031355532|nr:cation:proton antiporter [Dehalococcoidia bacterium]
MGNDAADRDHHTGSNRALRALLTLAMALGFAWLAYEVGGLAEVTGSFLAGVMLSSHRPRPPHQSSRSPAFGTLFIPIFFVYIGSSVNLRRT